MIPEWLRDPAAKTRQVRSLTLPRFHTRCRELPWPLDVGSAPHEMTCTIDDAKLSISFEDNRFVLIRLKADASDHSFADLLGWISQRVLIDSLVVCNATRQTDPHSYDLNICHAFAVENGVSDEQLGVWIVNAVEQCIHVLNDFRQSRIQGGSS